jgi:glycosyltransferase involved in cell wall biosynthesis
VIIPAYNAEASIRQTIQSVLSQVYQPIEILVVDDGSHDQTSAIVRELAQKDARLQLFCQSNLGVAAARNLAISNATGEFIAPIDADDIWHPYNWFCCKDGSRAEELLGKKHSTEQLQRFHGGRRSVL